MIDTTSFVTKDLAELVEQLLGEHYLQKSMPNPPHFKTTGTPPVLKNIQEYLDERHYIAG